VRIFSNPKAALLRQNQAGLQKTLPSRMPDKKKPNLGESWADKTKIVENQSAFTKYA